MNSPYCNCACPTEEHSFSSYQDPTSGAIVNTWTCHNCGPDECQQSLSLAQLKHTGVEVHSS